MGAKITKNCRFWPPHCHLRPLAREETPRISARALYHLKVESLGYTQKWKVFSYDTFWWRHLTSITGKAKNSWTSVFCNLTISYLILTKIVHDVQKHRVGKNISLKCMLALTVVQRCSSVTDYATIICNLSALISSLMLTITVRNIQVKKGEKAVPSVKRKTIQLFILSLSAVL